jgi:hypothetical protein
MAPRPEDYRPADAELGEGPCWDPGRGALIWVDILRREVHLSTPGENRVHRTHDYVGAAVPAADGELREQPLAGSVLVVEPGVAGLPPTPATGSHLSTARRRA